MYASKIAMLSNSPDFPPCSTMKKLRDLGYDQEVEYLDQKDKRILRQHEFIIEDLLLTDDRECSSV